MKKLCIYKVLMNVREYRGAIKDEDFRETGNIGYIRHKTKTNKAKTKHNCVGHHYTQANTNNVNTTR